MSRPVQIAAPRGTARPGLNPPSGRRAPARSHPDREELDALQQLLEGRELLCLMLEELVEAATEGLVALDFRGRVVHISKSLLDPALVRPDGASWPGPGAADAAFPESCLPRAVRLRLRRESAGMAAGDTVRFDLHWPRPERGTEVYRVTATAGSDAGGTPIPAGRGPADGAPARRLLTIFAFSDKTREATLERELTESRNLASLGQMAATVAHELRNPLGAIQGFADLLHRDLAGQPALRRQAERILRGVEGANRIVSDLLEYTRPVAPHRTPVPLADLLEESIAAWRASARASDGATADLVVDSDLPDCLCDARLLQQALQNLYTNAVQAMGEGGTFFVRARAAGPPGRPDRLRIVVRDTGCGLGADEVARVFQPFYTTRPGGTGLGLPLVRRIVEAHGGHVHVVSAPGRGTSVVIDLPAAGLESPVGRDLERESAAASGFEEMAG